MEEDVLTHLVILDLNTLSHDEILDNQEYVIKFYGNTPDNINTTHDILYIDWYYVSSSRCQEVNFISKWTFSFITTRDFCNYIYS